MTMETLLMCACAALTVSIASCPCSARCSSSWTLLDSDLFAYVSCGGAQAHVRNEQGCQPQDAFAARERLTLLMASRISCSSSEYRDSRLDGSGALATLASGTALAASQRPWFTSERLFTSGRSTGKEAQTPPPMFATVELSFPIFVDVLRVALATSKPLRTADVP